MDDILREASFHRQLPMLGRVGAGQPRARLSAVLALPSFCQPRESGGPDDALSLYAVGDPVVGHPGDRSGVDQPAGGLTNREIQAVARRNRLLASLPAADADELLLRLRHVVLPNERVLLAPRESVQYA